MEPMDNLFEIINPGNGGGDVSPMSHVCLITCPDEGAGCVELGLHCPTYMPMCKWKLSFA